jgi:hypothetical protein
MSNTIISCDRWSLITYPCARGLDVPRDTGSSAELSHHYMVSTRATRTRLSRFIQVQETVMPRHLACLPYLPISGILPLKIWSMWSTCLSSLLFLSSSICGVINLSLILSLIRTFLKHCFFSHLYSAFNVQLRLPVSHSHVGFKWAVATLLQSV